MTTLMCPICHDVEVSSLDVGRILKPAEYKVCETCLERAWEFGRRMLYGLRPASQTIRDATGSTEPNPGAPPQNYVFPGDRPQSAPAPIEPGPDE